MGPTIHQQSGLRTSGFRHDVEGLRAVAVLAILVFHLDPSWLPGGFVGVDVFFVISGYLITGQILAVGDGFSFRRFYLRRLLRLYPALVVVAGLTMAAGYIRLAPAEFKSLAGSAMAALLGVSNLWFLADIDYFNPETALRPLLHTWSLGVEEQFYLAWPLLLVAAIRRRPARPVLVAGVALLLAIILALLAPAWLGGPSAFYLPLFRLHEFGLGALLHLPLLAPRLPAGQSRAVAGLALVILVLTMIAPAAGPLAVIHRAELPACLATAALIAVGAFRPLAVLQAAPLTALGRWSYSIYLVHWPLIVFARDIKPVPLTPLDLALCGAASIALGAILFATVERTFRIRGPSAGRIATFWTPAVRLRLLAAAGLLGLAISAVVFVTDGLPRRVKGGMTQVSPSDLTYAGDLCSARRTVCVFGDRTSSTVVYLLGDSYALNLVYGLDELFRERHVRGVAYFNHGCLFLKGTQRINDGQPDARCTASVAAAYGAVEGDTAPVILAGAWLNYPGKVGPKGGPVFMGTGQDYVAWMEPRLRDSARAIVGAGRPLVVVATTYETPVSVPACLLRPDRPDEAKCGFPTREDALARGRGMDEAIGRLQDLGPSVRVVDPKSVICRELRCTVREGDTLYLRDSAHLTNAGSSFLVRGLREPLLEGLGLDR